MRFVRLNYLYCYKKKTNTNCLVENRLTTFCSGHKQECLVYMYNMYILMIKYKVNITVYHSKFSDFVSASFVLIIKLTEIYRWN